MSATAPTNEAFSVFQDVLDDAVGRRVGPGFQYVVFTRDKLLFNGVSGMASVPLGKPYTPSTIVWTASCTKLTISLIVLHTLERGLAKNGMSLADLDNHEALIEVLPEFKCGSGSLVTKILEGFENKLGPDGKKVMRLRDVQGKVTLRMLLTHTAGTGYAWNHHELSELYRPSDGSVPNNHMHPVSGAIRDFEVPLVFEPGTAYHYGFATDWLGQFVIRATGRNLRQLLKDIIFNPLGIPPTEADIWISPALQSSCAEIHVRDPASNSGFSTIVFKPYSEEHGPAEGKAYVAESAVYASAQAFSRVLQAVLDEDTRILSKNVWRMAIKDDLKGRGVGVQRPDWKTAMPDLSFDVDEFSKSVAKDGASLCSMNLLQCKVATGLTLSGRPIGSFAWGGLANTYYFVDPVTGIGAMLSTQLFPFYDAQVIELRDKLESLVYKTLGAGSI